MLLGFTVFATTVGFFLWYLLEVAMDIFIDVFMEMNNFFDRAWQALIILCIEGQVPAQVNTMLAGSVRRMFASFGKLANRTKTFLNNGEFYEYGAYDVGVMLPTCETMLLMKPVNSYCEWPRPVWLIISWLRL
jgi:hypothetical protein